MNKNEKMEQYRLPIKTLYSEKEVFRWPGNYLSAIFFLSNIPKFNNLEHYYKHNNFDDDVMNKLQNWSLEEVTKSALFYYLDIRIEERKKIETDVIVMYDWQIISFLLLHPKLTNELFNFLEYLGLLSFFSEKMMISGTLQTVKALSKRKKSVSNPIGLSKVLNFLGVDSLSIKVLVDQAVKEDSFDIVVAFLYTFEAGVTNNYILTETLRNYQAAKKGRILSKEEFDQFTNDSWVDLRDYLQTFNVFDPFDSFDQSKTSRISAHIIYLSFINELNDGVIEIFELFERFLHSSKNKKEVYLEDLSSINLQKISNQFCSANQNQIEKNY